MSEAHEGNVLATYQSLRVAMIHTPVRGAFVLALAGLGACLIAYKGNADINTAAAVRNNVLTLFLMAVLDDPPVRHWNNRYAAVAAATLGSIGLAILFMTADRT
jgi:hypothetical protein